MSCEFDSCWAKDFVLGEMERDGCLDRARRAAMGVVCGSARMWAYGTGLMEARRAANGFAAAASVFKRLAAAPEPWSARAAGPGDWREAARRALAKAGRGQGGDAPRPDGARSA